MAVTIESTTDSPAEVERAIRMYGGDVESTLVDGESEKKEAAAPDAEAGKAQVEAEPADSQTAAESGTGEETAGAPRERKPSAGIQKRIDELTRERYERDGRISELEKRIAEMQRPKEEKPAEAKPEAPVLEAEAQPKPQVGDFPDYEQFVEALTDWKADQREAKSEAKLTANLNPKLAELQAKLDALTAEDRAKSEAAAREELWADRVNTAKADYDDWDQVAEQAKKMKISHAMLKATGADEKGPHVMYYLASHPEEAAKVFDATAYPENASEEVQREAHWAANRELGRILGRIEAAATAAPATPKTPANPKPKAVSAAPEPIEPVRPGARAAGVDPYDKQAAKEMSFSEYNEWRKTHPHG